MKKCEHAGCRCGDAKVERSGRQYCSEFCASGRTAAGGQGKGCGCGHADCA
jgi:hypothetical protein